MDDREPSAHPGLPSVPTAVPSLNSLFASITAEAFPSAPGAFENVPHQSYSTAASLFHPLDHSPSESVAESSVQTTQSSTESCVRRRSRRLAVREAARAARDASVSSEKSADEDHRREKRCGTSEETWRPAKRCRFAVKAPPNAKDDSNYDVEDTKNEVEETSASTEEGISCCICMSEPERADLSAVNGCDHKFCFDCIAQWADRENKCPLCKVRFSKISRVHKESKKKGDKSPILTKRVKDRNQRADLVSGAALEAMLSSIAASNRASIGGPRLGRVLFAAVGGRSRSAPRRAALFVEGGSDEDSTDIGFPFPHDFNELMRHTMNVSRRENRRTPFGASVGVGLGINHSMHSSHSSSGSTWSLQAPPLFSILQRQPRSYASNVNDTNAGRAAENPLEIDDSDDDDDVVIIDPPNNATA